MFFRFLACIIHKNKDKISKNSDTIPALDEIFSLSPVRNKPIEVSFTTPDFSSQGGFLG